MNRSADDFREYDPEVVIANVERDYGRSLAEVCRRFIFSPAAIVESDGDGVRRGSV